MPVTKPTTPKTRRPEGPPKLSIKISTNGLPAVQAMRWISLALLCMVLSRVVSLLF